MNIDILKHAIVNVCKSVTYGMKKPDKKFFRHSLESLLEYRTTVLSHLGDTTEKDASHILAYFSYHLGKPVFRNLATKIFVILTWQNKTVYIMGVWLKSFSLFLQKIWRISNSRCVHMLGIGKSFVDFVA